MLHFWLSSWPTDPRLAEASADVPDSGYQHKGSSPTVLGQGQAVWGLGCGGFSVGWP